MTLRGFRIQISDDIPVVCFLSKRLNSYLILLYLHNVHLNSAQSFPYHVMRAQINFLYLQLFDETGYFINRFWAIPEIFSLKLNNNSFNSNSSLISVRFTMYIL